MASQVEKVLQRMRHSIAADQCYEGEQMLRTAYHRLAARGDQASARQLLTQGAALQLRQGQSTCGADLAQLLLRSYRDEETTPSTESLAPVRLLLEAFEAAALREADAGSASSAAAGRSADPASAGPPDPAPAQAPLALSLARRFGSDALRWASAGAARGSPEALRPLYQALAHLERAAQGWRGAGAALPMLARAGDAAGGAELVAEAVARSSRPEEEAPLFAARAALEFAAAGGRGEESLRSARKLLQLASGAAGEGVGARAEREEREEREELERVAGAEASGAREGGVAGSGEGAAGRQKVGPRSDAAPHAFQSPLFNFADMFLGALERGSAPLARYLLKVYAPYLRRDPRLQALARTCCDQHCGSRSAAGPATGLMGGLLSALGGLA